MDSQRKPRGTGYGRGDYGYRYGSSYGYGGYGYGGYGYGGYGGSGETLVQRTLKDYLMVARERIWYIVTTLLVVFASTLVYTFTATPIFKATAMIEVFRRNPMVMQVQEVMDSEVRSIEDLNTQVNILKSGSIIDRVADRLTGEEKQRFLAPYVRQGSPAPRITGILALNREIAPERSSYIIDINYFHPDREIAAKVANLFADEYIAYSAHMMVDESLRAVEELDQRVNEQRKKVDDIAAALQAFREKSKMVSLDQRKDIVTEKLKGLNNLVTQGSAALQDAETRWKQVVASREHGDNLLNLLFIANVPAVSQLQQQVASSKIAVAQLSRRYKSKHPAMQQAVNSLNEAEQELQRAIDTSTAQVETEYQTALQNYTKAQAALAAQENETLKLDRFGLEYSNLERDFEVNEKLLEHILERMRETSMSSTVESQNSRIVDRAVPGSRPVSPKYSLNLALGVIGGLGLGLALAFFIAYADDRVKSASDIEMILGLPILGIIPEIKKLGKAEHMGKAITGGASREITEAFTTLLSSLKLKEESKNAKCILVTSTIASEGKTFIITNLATIFAAHGERVVVVDCDLRRPAVNRVFGIENLKGVIDVCANGMQLDEVIVKDVRPRVDVIPTGGRSKNPTQILSAKEFAVMISELRKRYDRIFIDTPPVAIVGDALILLPLVDGWLYSIYFNKVRRKAAEYSMKRLLDVNVPSFGAVLNGLTGGIGGYYYSHYYAAYYDKSYKNYYVTAAEEGNGDGVKISENGQSTARERRRRIQKP